VTENSRRQVRAPEPLLQFLESRAVFEFGAFLAASPVLRMFGRGDRHPVLVLPGFTGGDDSTLPLRWVLRSQGYWVHPWRLGANVGPTPEVIDGIHARLAALHARHERKVSLVGWSLGGIYAREMARKNPGAVRQVITMGSPFRMIDGDRSSVPEAVTERMSERWNKAAMHMSEEEHNKPALEVHSTAIYSRSDGVARWHTCIDVESEIHENVEVHSSHSGLGINPAAIYVVCDRLAQPEDDWRRFAPPPGTRHLFPRPVSWQEAS
jgi:pimeloyl-ACP methyl ester carboxylesterase